LQDQLTTDAARTLIDTFKRTRDGTDCPPSERRNAQRAPAVAMPATDASRD
jgi:hypothetical protein